MEKPFISEKFTIDDIHKLGSLTMKKLKICRKQNVINIIKQRQIVLKNI